VIDHVVLRLDPAERIAYFNGKTSQSATDVR
jgi:hypothetical protein